MAKHLLRIAVLLPSAIVVLFFLSARQMPALLQSEKAWFVVTSIAVASAIYGHQVDKRRAAEVQGSPYRPLFRPSVSWFPRFFGWLVALYALTGLLKVGLETVGFGTDQTVAAGDLSRYALMMGCFFGAVRALAGVSLWLARRVDKKLSALVPQERALVATLIAEMKAARDFKVNYPHARRNELARQTGLPVGEILGQLAECTSRSNGEYQLREVFRS